MRLVCLNDQAPVRSLYLPYPKIIRSIENFVGDISSVTIIESKLTEDLLVLDVSSYQSEHELFLDMEDNEIEQVLDRLNKPTAP